MSGVKKAERLRDLTYCNSKSLATAVHEEGKADPSLFSRQKMEARSLTEETLEKEGKSPNVRSVGLDRELLHRLQP